MAAPKSTKTPKSSKSPARRAAATRKPAARTDGDKKSVALNTLSIGAAVGVLAAGVFGLLKLARNVGAGRGGEHVPTDLMGDKHPDGGERAIEAFRPDPSAPIPASERDAFRPALAGAQAPTLVAGQAGDIPRSNGAASS